MHHNTPQSPLVYRGELEQVHYITYPSKFEMHSHAPHPNRRSYFFESRQKERVKPKRVRAMNMTLHSSIKDKILAALKKARDESAGLQKGLDEKVERKSDGALFYLDRIWVPLKGDVRTLIMDDAYKSK
uniref:Putative reverse transcriptase domain-containing protein n=1 Tax=Tanacetum cinerariifolium TaxID=118510 RepID=A0A699QF64_TANCI|nr:putative reverse transcriptase domain-containing protein [Tanacetum cinerariifolium]